MIIKGQEKLNQFSQRQSQLSEKLFINQIINKLKDINAIESIAYHEMIRFKDNSTSVHLGHWLYFCRPIKDYSVDFLGFIILASEAHKHKINKSNFMASSGLWTNLDSKHFEQKFYSQKDLTKNFYMNFFHYKFDSIIWSWKWMKWVCIIAFLWISWTLMKSFQLVRIAFSLNLLNWLKWAKSKKQIELIIVSVKFRPFVRRLMSKFIANSNDEKLR